MHPLMRRAGCALISTPGLARDCRARDNGRARGQGRRGELAGERRKADQVQDRSVQHRPGPERDRLRDHPREAPGRRLLHAHPPRPDLSGRPRAGCGGDPSPSRCLGQHRTPGRDLVAARGALLRRRRGEDDHASAQGLRIPDQGVGLPAPQPHDPQPDAGADAGVHGLRRGLRAEGLTRRPRDALRSPDLDGRPERQPLPGLQRRKGLRRQGPLHVSRRCAEPLRQRSQEERVGGGQAGRAGGHRRSPASRAASTRICTCAGAARRFDSRAGRTLHAAVEIPPTCSARWPSTTSRRGPCRGMWP